MLKKLAASEGAVRTVGTITYGALAIVLFIVGGIPLLIVFTTIALLGAHEFCRLWWNAGARPSYVVCLAGALILMIDAYFAHQFLPYSIGLILVLSLVWAVWRLISDRKDANRPAGNLIKDWALTLIGAAYTGGLLGYVLMIRALPNGARLLLMTALAAAMVDVMAYVVGSRIGRHPFMAHISPRKTWEGAIGGFLSGVIVILVLAPAWAGMSPQLALVWGVALSVIQIAGDLLESKMKRLARVKDTGAIVPRQGGALDVVDGFLLSVPFSYYFLIRFVPLF